VIRQTMGDDNPRRIALQTNLDRFLQTRFGFHILSQQAAIFDWDNGDGGVVWLIGAADIFGRVPQTMSAAKMECAAVRTFRYKVGQFRQQIFAVCES